MAEQDVNLSGKTGQDKEMAEELRRLREENARLQAKRENDESSAFGRLARESELRRQREQENEQLRQRMAELEQKNLLAALPPDAAEALGAAGVAGVKAIVDRSLPAVSDPSGKLSELEARLAAAEAAQRDFIARKTYTDSLVSWAAQSGMPGLFARLMPGGDLRDKWAAFAQQYPGALAADKSGDTEGVKAYVKLFLHENPGFSQTAGTPPPSGGFAPPADPKAYGPQQWLAEVNALEAGLMNGTVSKADHAKGVREANAKLAAAQQQGQSGIVR